MKNNKDQLLKDFLEGHFDFEVMQEVGFFPKEITKEDIHAQADRICKFFGYKTIYEYGAKKIRAHISYEEGHRPLHIDDSGELKSAPFVEEFGGIYD